MENEVDNYGADLAVAGFGIGGYVGYVLRPAVNGYGMYGKLGIPEIIAFSSHGNDYLHLIAVESMHTIIAGALIGLVLGWVLGKNTKRSIKNKNTNKPKRQPIVQFKPDYSKPKKKTKLYGRKAAIFMFLFIALIGTYAGVQLAGPDHFAYGLVGGSLAGSLAGVLYLLKKRDNKNQNKNKLTFLYNANKPNFYPGISPEILLQLQLSSGTKRKD